MTQTTKSTDFIEISSQKVHEYLPILVENDIPLRRRKKDGSFSFIPPAEFDNYLRDTDMVFYLDRDSLDRVKKEAARQVHFGEKKEVPVPEKQAASEKPAAPVDDYDHGFARSLENAESMDIIERIQAIMNSNYRMRSFIEEGRRFDPDTIKETSDIFAESLSIKKVTMQENIDSGVDQAHMKAVMDGSRTLVDNLLQLLVKGRASFVDLAQLEHVQTGSSTLNHMNRMMIRYLSFIFFYNSYFQNRSTEVKKIRAQFKDRFLPYYDKLFKGEQHVSLEIVFKDGFTPIRSRSQLVEYAMGGLIHDIGKLPEIAYHDGSQAFDAARARRHVFDGYNLLLTSGEFSAGIVATALLHHDYYLSKKGYRQLPTFRTKFVDRRNIHREHSPTKYAISYNINDVGYGNALSYFPNKVLELLDVFDSITDSDKGYRASKTPEEALQIIREDFLDGPELSLDPILFTIFADFLQTSGIVTEPAFLEEIKI